LAGTAPLVLPLSEEKLHRVSVFGAGLLVGTALAVIVPEGVQTLIGALSRSAVAGQEQQGHAHHLDGLDRAIGISLVLGFLFMLLIDQCASGKGGSSLGSDLEGGSRGGNVKWTTTLGLVVHAAADGIAMGAAATTRQTDIEVIVFMAIMLHKAPAAFGLTTFLMHEGLEKHRVRRHLMTFALSAPLTALATYGCLNWSGGSSQSLDTFTATGIAMLFSAGTFLYVATVHVLPEVTSVGHSHGGNGKSHSGGFSAVELGLLVIGSLLPLLLTLGHHH